jgi:phospholipase C
VSYPVTAIGLALGAPADPSTAEIPFRPAASGLVNVIVVGMGRPAPWTPEPGEPAGVPTPFHGFSVSVRVDIYKPGAGTPAGTGTARIDITDPDHPNRIALSTTATATDADLAADWRVVITNGPGGVPTDFVPSAATYDATIRYQVMPTALGNIDHFVFVMMENRSFDQVLGYLSIPTAHGGKGRSEVCGLTGNEYNVFNGTVVGVHRRQAPPSPPGQDPYQPTSWISDAGHGTVDVTLQLSGDLSPTPGVQQLKSNAGFVASFAEQHEAFPETRTVIIAAGATRDITFGPVVTGKITVRTQVTVEADSSGASPKPVNLALLAPGTTTPVATANGAPPAPAPTLSYTFDQSSLEGQWTLTVTNTNSLPQSVQVDLSYSHLLWREDPGEAMAYYAGDQLPVFEALAERFAICDQWYCSIPTDTWPNRLYALTGGSGGMNEGPPTSEVESRLPGYSLTTVFEVLQGAGVDWGIYFSDLPFELVFTNLARNATYTSGMRDIYEFERVARDGALPSLSWVEPNFQDVPDGQSNASDDHAPGDLARGQAFIARVYDAVRQSPAWPKTALVITYDEHGGFYDHVLPPGNPVVNDTPAPGGPPADQPEQHAYGPRVPTFVISPWVERGSVNSTAYDHTSLLATLLNRFCRQPDGTTPSMGPRSDAATDIEALFSAPTPDFSADPPPPPPTASTAAIPAPSPDTFEPVLRKMLLGF